MAWDVRSRYAMEVPDNQYNTLAIDLGDHGWKHPDEMMYIWSNEASARRYAEEKNLDPSKVYEVDTRLTLQEVRKILQEKEGETWDEYLDVNYDFRPDKLRKWPIEYHWISVYVVTGGSEGLYLHIDRIDNEGRREMLFLGKSLGHSWEECWLSAARIAAMLGA